MSDPSQRRRLLPKSIIKSKLKFLTLELFDEFAPYAWFSFNFYMLLFIYIVAFWWRIYIHYLAGYLYLQAIGSPIYNFIPDALFISYKYMSASVSEATEVGFVAVGPFANIIMFIFFGFCGRLFYHVSRIL